jgi:hypothetical protein
VVSESLSIFENGIDVMQHEKAVISEDSILKSPAVSTAMPSMKSQHFRGLNFEKSSGVHSNAVPEKAVISSHSRRHRHADHSQTRKFWNFLEASLHSNSPRVAIPPKTSATDALQLSSATSFLHYVPLLPLLLTLSVL